MRLATVLFLSCVRLLAQFQNLVTNDDGSVLYFSSELRQRGSDQFPHAKLFVLDSAGLRLYLQRPSERTTSVDATWPVSNYYALDAVALHGSGFRTAVIARRDCYGGSGCLPTPRVRSELDEQQYRGRMSLSRNGRYALLFDDGSMLSPTALVNLQTGTRRDWLFPSSGRTRYGRRQVSSTGVGVTANRDQLLVSTLDSQQTFTFAGAIENIVIDDAGQKVVYESELGIGLLDLTTGTVRSIADRSGAGIMQPCLSNDGKAVVFLDGAQVVLASTETFVSRRLTNEPSGIRELVLSGDGRIVYATTASGRLVKVNVETGEMQELIGNTPVFRLNLTSGYAVPGSSFTIAGAGFASTGQSAGAPLPLQLNGVQLLLGGVPLPLQTVEPERIRVQITWNSAPGTHTLEIAAAAHGNFETEPASLEVRESVFAQFETLSPEIAVSVSLLPYPLAAHGDFSALVTPANPARRGEVVHLYMTGLGPVEPAVGSGEAGPADPPARLVTPVSCVVSDRDAEVLFAGLAPGFVGYYQVSIRIPEDVRPQYEEVWLACRPGGPATGDSRFLPLKE